MTDTAVADQKKEPDALTVLRAGYRPPAWAVVEVHLDVALDPVATRVSSRLVCERRGEGPLLLDGEDFVETVSVVLDGHPLPETQRPVVAGRMTVDVPGDAVVVEIVTIVNPQANATLSGLYQSRGGLFTQCEAEGFRRITWFPDRPDVMSRYRVRLEADRATYPVLLANGNRLDAGELPDGRHFALWEDPFSKPCYLFALVAADLVCLERTIRRAGGRDALLQVWVEAGKLDRAGHAMASLAHAMRWDEARFGLELDLDRYMIVAVSDFNMGAMENKGLNIFNDKYVLAKPETATDIDYAHIESVVAHEYFHNWTGNRVTCRDWFQLTLKEGLTVFRDQQFSADMLALAAGEAGADSARAVKRIDDVRVLRAAQFPEDAGPMAHPIRPDSYQEINNFYTATVYEKGAEVIRMIHTLLGEAGFRKGMDLYFDRHDGQAVTCDDFVAAMADATGFDLSRFMRWYGQAGTPRLKAELDWDPASGVLTLDLAQYTLPTPGQPDKLPLVIPLAVGLIDDAGRDLPVMLDDDPAPVAAGTRLLMFVEARQRWCFTGLRQRPRVSLLRGFSAPVVLALDESVEDLAFRMAHDSDPFCRWDAAQRLAERYLLGTRSDAGAADVLVNAFAAVLDDASLAPAFRVQMLTLPAESILLEQMSPADPARLRQRVVDTVCLLGQRLCGHWQRWLAPSGLEGSYRYHPTDAGLRAMRALALRYLCAVRDPQAIDAAVSLYHSAGNLTDRMAALVGLMQSSAPEREAVNQDFRERYAGDALVLDKWFALQATRWRWPDESADDVLSRVKALCEDPAFSLGNPNRVYALLGSYFRNNPAGFHREDGAGYTFWATQVLALDARNPQVASRMARALENWRRYPETLRSRIEPCWRHVLAEPHLSPDVREVATKALSAAAAD